MKLVVYSIISKIQKLLFVTILQNVLKKKHISAITAAETGISLWIIFFKISSYKLRIFTCFSLICVQLFKKFYLQLIEYLMSNIMVEILKQFFREFVAFGQKLKSRKTIYIFVIWIPWSRLCNSFLVFGANGIEVWTFENCDISKSISSKLVYF